MLHNRKSNQCCTLAALDHKVSRILMHVYKTANLTFSFWCTRIVVRVGYSRNGWLNGDLSASRLKSDGRWRTETLAFRVELGTELRVSLHRFFASSRSIFLILPAFHIYFFLYLPSSPYSRMNAILVPTLTRFGYPLKLFAWFVNWSFSMLRWMFKLLND